MQSTKQIADTMQQAEQEIMSLRRLVERLEPEAAAFRSITKILGLLPQPSQGASVDVAWLLRRAINEISDRDQPARAAAQMSDNDVA